MSATITAEAGGQTVPLTILSPWQTSWTSRSVVHDLIGDGIAVSIVTPRLRAGEMELLYATEAEAFACATLHTTGPTFTLTETERPHLDMSYVVDGVIRVRLDEQTLEYWVVTVGYQEVTP